jgi:hypothetical protein
MQVPHGNVQGIAMLQRGTGARHCNGIHFRENQNLDMVRMKGKNNSKQSISIFACLEENKVSNIL